MEYLAFGGRCLIGVIFVTSAVSKLHSRSAYQEFVRTTQILLGAILAGRRVSRADAQRAGIAVVAVEVAVPVLIAAPPTTRVGFGAAVVLLGAFGLAIGASMRRGVRTSCRCFGASAASLGVPHLVRNGVLVLTAAGGVVAGHSGLGQASAAGLVVAAGTAFVLAVLIARLDDLLELFTPRGAVDGRKAG